MPIHDWTRVSTGTWHDFHLAWIAGLQLSLNDGVLPSEYYAQTQNTPTPLEPDAPTFQTEEINPEDELIGYTLKRRTIVIRHNSDDRIIALLELVSPGNQASQHGIRSFVEKAVEAIYRGYHLLIVDLFPPTPRDPNGLHAAIWSEFSAQTYEQPPELPLTLVAYSSGLTKRVYLEATSVGQELIEMPLFLKPEIYVNVPLEATYRAAFRGVPKKWKEVLEKPITQG